MIDALAGKSATSAPLVDISKLITAYYTVAPDPAVASQRVAFGTSGHRGSSFDASFNEQHVLAITQAIVLYRSRAGASTARCFWASTHTPCRSRPVPVRSRCWPPTACDVMIAEPATNTRRHRPSRTRSLTYNKGRTAGLADGIVVSPSHNPPDSGGFKYNPVNGGPAGSDITGWIEKQANAFHRGSRWKA